MPIILNNSNITVDYKASNFNIESVKSELYLKNTTYDNYLSYFGSGNIRIFALGYNNLKVYKGVAGLAY